MLYLGTSNSPDIRAAMRTGTIGAMLTFGAGCPSTDTMAGITWAADNGCFSQGDKFDLGRFLDWLSSRSPTREACLFATAPDVMTDHVATLARSAPALQALRQRGWPCAFVGQNGATPATLPWAEFDALFIGGDTPWKLGPDARACVGEAKRRGKWAHMGRVNSLKRMRYAAAIGCDSVDGTKLAFGPDVTLPWLLRSVRHVNDQGTLAGMDDY